MKYSKLNGVITYAPKSRDELIDYAIENKPHIQQNHKAVYQGLGGSFDVYIGEVKRGPNWWVNNNLEWAYRLINQPSRIIRQIHLLRFFVLLKLNKF
jgi:exopolysaccharide biosynthesis WecB/TagA/CpsF family protein